MNRKRLILLAIVVVLAICISIAFHYWNKAQQEKEAADRDLRNKYGYTAGSLHLDVDTSEYEQTGDFHDIELTPTDLTYDLLQRWESITEVIPTIDYPKEAVEKEDWLKVFSTLADNRFEAMDVSKEITKGNEEATTDSMAILDYLYKGIVYNDYFREFLEDNGIEGPDQRD